MVAPGCSFHHAARSWLKYCMEYRSSYPIKNSCSLPALSTLPRLTKLFKVRCFPVPALVAGAVNDCPALRDEETDCCTPAADGRAIYIYPQSIRKSSPFFCKTGCATVPAFRIERPFAVYFPAFISCELVLAAISVEAPKYNCTSCEAPSFD